MRAGGPGMMSNRACFGPGYSNRSPSQARRVLPMDTSKPPQARRLSEREAAERLGISPRTLQFWRHRSYGPAYLKLGRRVAYHPSDLDAFEASCRVQPKGGVE